MTRRGRRGCEINWGFIAAMLFSLVIWAEIAVSLL